MRTTNALAALCLAAFSLAACSGKKTEDSSTTQTTIPATESAANTTSPPENAAAAAPVAYASLTGDAVHGKTIFLQCGVCHTIDPGVNKIGPSLHAIIGRHSGEIPGFAYSAANKNSGIEWSEEELFKYLEAPQKVVPGTKMAFAGLKKPQDRADVIAYLKSATK